MTAIACTPALAPFPRIALARPFAMLHAFAALVPIRDAFVAAWLVIAASAVVYADDRFQDWIPGVLAFPADAEVVTDRAIGSTVRLFSFATGADVDALLTDWSESLSGGGYAVTQDAEDLLERSIEFSGPGIFNAKIVAVPTADDGRNIIEFDATLD